MKMQVAEVFHFTSTDLVNSKQLSPQVWCIALDNTVYLNALQLSIIIITPVHFPLRGQ